jgi:hypothetical protein
MSSENFDAKQELISGEAGVEERELDPSSREVVGIIAEDTERLEADGQYELEGLSEGLPENDPMVASTREHLASIAGRAKELTKWAAASLALSMAQPAVAESPEQAVNATQTEAGQSYELKYDNPQRAGYASPEGYREYLSQQWEGKNPRENAATHDLSEADSDVASLRRQEMAETFQILDEAGHPRSMTEDEVNELLSKFYDEKGMRTLTESEIKTLPLDKYPNLVEDVKKFDSWFNGLDEVRKYSENKDLVQRYAESQHMSDEQITADNERFLTAFDTADRTREAVGKIVNSDTYEDRALHNEGLTEEQLAERRQRVLSDNIRLTDPRYKLHQEKILGEWNPTTDKIALDTDDATNPDTTTAAHEIEHSITKGNDGLSRVAVDLYKKALSVEGVKELASEDFGIDHFSDPTEIDARRMAFIYEFQKLTDWRYGQPFTAERVEQAKQLLEEGKLDDGAQFLKIIDENHLIEVMDTLAENETDQIVKGERIEKA